MANPREQVHIRPYGTVTENARRIVRARLTELYIWAQYTRDARRVREQHQMRIAAKRLRYTLELFRDFLPEGTGECIKALKGLQDDLGLLHDCDVLIAILRSALLAPDADARLLAAIPEAQDLPPALLEVLGQRARMDGASPLTASQPPDAQKQGKHGKDAKGKRRLRARKKAKAEKRQRAARIDEEARSRVRPTGEQGAALEQFLEAKAREREDLYRQVVKSWDKMEEHNFRATVLRLVDGAETPGHLVPHPVAAQDALKQAQNP
jgi:hypothetical protein